MSYLNNWKRCCGCGSARIRNFLPIRIWIRIRDDMTCLTRILICIRNDMTSRIRIQIWNYHASRKENAMKNTSFWITKFNFWLIMCFGLTNEKSCENFTKKKWILSGFGSETTWKVGSGSRSVINWQIWYRSRFVKTWQVGSGSGS